MTWLWQDLKFGIRTLLKDRGFLLTCVLALALGIGSVSIIFSVIDNVLLEPFPYTGASRLFVIQIHDSGSTEPYGRSAFSQPEFLDYQQQNAIFDGSIGASEDRVLWTGEGPPESFLAASVTGNTFPFLGVGALAGRYSTPADANPGAPPSFVMSYKVWQKRFAGDHGILGKTFILDGTPRTLVGIMPKRFAWMGADIWIPAKADYGEKSALAPYFFLLGHLKPGLTVKSAQANVAVVAQRLAKVYPKQYPKKFDVRLQTLADMVVGTFRTTLFTLLAAVGLLLLIACANVANLLLAKATTREKEFAIRNSVGARRWHIVRQLMVESLLLGLAGAAAGCVFAWAGLKVLVAVLPRFTFPDEAAISLNPRVLVATMLIAVLTSLLFGLAPMLGSFSKNLSEPLKAGGRGNSGFRRGRLRNVLMTGEVALSLLLLAGAGLMMRSFLAQRQADLGFRLDHLMASDVGLGKKYSTIAQQIRFARELTTQLAAIPGVQSATAAIDFAPFGGISTDFDILGRTHREVWKGQMGFVDAEFFSTIGMRLLRGRLLTKDDVEGKHKVVVINQTLAKKYFATEDPIGKNIKLLGMAQLPEPLANPWFEIVGVASDLRNHGVTEDVMPETYAPITFAGVGEYLVYVRAVGNPAALAKAIDGAVLKLDRSVRPNETQSMEGLLDQYQYAKPRFAVQIFSVFAVVGLILVSVGVYSVVSYAVAQQTREIGIRMALGASSRNVLRYVLMGGMRFIAAGVLVGIVAGLVLMRFMKSQLSGVSPNDPFTFGFVAIVLVLVGLIACYLPSMRATRVDPLVSLQCE